MTHFDITGIIDGINEHFIWGVPMLILFIGTGLYFTLKLKFFQFGLINILRNTIFAGKRLHEKNTLSPLRTLTSTLAVTLGTGNIAALGTAIVFGGAGAVFWMWVSALLGMATSYAENYLGMLHRKKTESGYTSGVFVYIERALGRGGGAMFAVCCVLASFGMGNMTQVNALAKAAENSFGAPAWVSGALSALIAGIVIIGGAMFFGEVTEKVIPFISAVYILGCFIVIFINIDAVPAVFSRIISEAFSFRAVGGAAISWGFRRGIFSNEAGLGSSVIISSMSAEKNPRIQSLWATLAVFFDTIVVCTLTAFAILLTDADKTGGEGVTLANTAFRTAFADYADIFVTASLCIFALATVCGWSVFGVSGISYLFGERKRRSACKIYIVIFIACCFIGAVTELRVVWGAADIFNGLMAVPNLISLIILRKDINAD